ncbi:chloride channel protein [Devosia sp. SL43]|uniref:chloride channel protein n=1 Tax=Devosia sp. SL43 TaxID=2806348 RepID=UPI001F3C5094|nr:chloride channel protein [Devosia sp. SL43]
MLEDANSTGEPDHAGKASVEIPEQLQTLRQRLAAWRAGIVGGLGIGARLRQLIRRRESWLVLLAVIVGAAAGLVVIVLRDLAYALQRVLYDLPDEQRLSALHSLPLHLALMPAAGGIILGVAMLFLRRRKSRYVDLVEANALHGGKLSMVDSLIITAQTVVSNGFGASVGLEAAYTQMGGGLASKLGDIFQLRRGDMRKLVGCGAAGAIAAAFGAPLTGAFYAFELIIGTYTIATLTPVVAASIAAVLVASLFGQGEPIVSITQAINIGLPQIVLIVLCGFATGGVGILLMRLVGLIEAAFSGLKIPTWARPAIGGTIVGCLALVTPAVLSAGHGALEHAFVAPPLPIILALLIVCLKIVASAVSLGSGFRGGLFFASLFLGAILGQAFYWLAAYIDPGLFPDPSVPMLVGMAGLAAAIVGGPLTMAFLALETSGSLPLTVAVLVAAVASSMLVRETFGYSFTTWRFHLRGETIRSAHDVGWMRNLTVGKMMRRDVKSVPDRITFKEFRRLYPLGAATRVIAVRDDGRYAGLIDVADAYGEGVDDDTLSVQAVLQYREVMLHPAMGANDAEALFEKHSADALVVVSDLAERKVIGTLTEAHLLRRYAEELEKARADLAA